MFWSGESLVWNKGMSFSYVFLRDNNHDSCTFMVVLPRTICMQLCKLWIARKTSCLWAFLWKWGLLRNHLQEDWLLLCFVSPNPLPKILELMWLKLSGTDMKFQACFCLRSSYFSKTIGWQEKSGFIIKRQRGTLSARALKVRQRLFVKSWRSFHKKGWFIENCCQNTCTSWQQQRQSPPFPNVLLSAS